MYLARIILVYSIFCILFPNFSSGADEFCPMPFTFNRVTYDTCTRAKVDGTPNKVEVFYWCPSPDNVDTYNYNLFLPNGRHGICHDFMKPPGITST